MHQQPEFEFGPAGAERPNKKRGFLTRLLRACLAWICSGRPRRGEEVAELPTIEF